MSNTTVIPRTPDANWVPASQVIPVIHEMTGQKPEFTIRRLLELAASARVPLEMRNGKWGTPRSNIPAVAAAIGIMPVTATEPTSSGKHQQPVKRDLVAA